MRQWTCLGDNKTRKVRTPINYEPRFTKWMDVLPQDLSHEIAVVLLIISHLDSAAAEVPVKFQSDCISLFPISRLWDFARSYGKTSAYLLNRIEAMLSTAYVCLEDHMTQCTDRREIPRAISQRYHYRNRLELDPPHEFLSGRYFRFLKMKILFSRRYHMHMYFTVDSQKVSKLFSKSAKAHFGARYSICRCIV